MNLVLDVGNTRIKYGVFQGHDLLHHGFWLASSPPEGLSNLFATYNGIECALWCQSGADHSVWLEQLPAQVKVIKMTHETELPIDNQYKTPKTLGLDRLALVSAAKWYAPGKASLVIDCGTCVTYDFIDCNGRYFGGAISPGLSMRYKAMHDQTNCLPLLQAQAAQGLYGDSTDRSMHQGAFRGLIHEIEGFIDQYQQHNPDLTTILTGGDLEILRDHIKNDIFAHPNFLLEGLNQILLLNKD